MLGSNSLRISNVTFKCANLYCSCKQPASQLPVEIRPALHCDRHRVRPLQSASHERTLSINAMQKTRTQIRPELSVIHSSCGCCTNEIYLFDGESYTLTTLLWRCPVRASQRVIRAESVNSWLSRLLPYFACSRVYGYGLTEVLYMSTVSESAEVERYRLDHAEGILNSKSAC